MLVSTYVDENGATVEVHKYTCPSGATVFIHDRKSPDFQERIERATADFMRKVLQERAVKQKKAMSN